MDLISRQKAIDAIDAIFPVDPTKSEYAQGIACGAALAKTYVGQLPSSQPEIILCRDCKYWLPHEQFGYDEDNEEYHDYCAKLVPEDEYYAFRRHADEWCSRAERRTDEE